MTVERMEGGKIYLRFMTDQDTDDIVRWRNNPRVRQNFIYQKLFTPQGHRKWIETSIMTGDAIQFIICEKETDRAVGSVYFRDISQEHHKAEYGIFIGEDDAAGRGIGTEACALACSYGFEIMKLHRIFLRAFASNQQAIRSYEKAGFTKEALLRDDVCIQGEFHDIVLMGFINPAERK
jgi:UDP-4-amino-4,6-dideoxy-N-acetyl-beta-L-altrosamine N-acetyltransferase